METILLMTIASTLIILALIGCLIYLVMENQAIETRLIAANDNKNYANKLLQESKINESELKASNQKTILSLSTQLRTAVDTIARQNAELERVEKILVDDYEPIEFVTNKVPLPREVKSAWGTKHNATEEERPAPTPVKQLSDVVKEQEAPLKVGDWVIGKVYGLNLFQKGEIERITKKGFPYVSECFLDPSTCIRVPHPDAVFDMLEGLQIK